MDGGAAQHPGPQPGEEGAGHPARLDVGVIGAGRVGAALGAALARAGHRLVGVSAVSDASRHRAETMLPGVPVRDPLDLAADAELLLVAVSDDAIAPVVAGLAAAGGIQAGQIVVHPCGARGTEVLAPVLARHALPLALHPAMTFTGTPVDLERLVGAPFAVTCDDRLRPLGEALAIDMGGEPVFVAERDRAAYHAALCHAANHATTLVAQAKDILAGIGVEHPDRLLTPVVSAMVDNALRAGDGLITGPVSRGDVGTVRAHLEALAGSPSIAAAYAAMARATTDRAEAAGRIGAAAADELRDALAAADGRDG